MTLNFYKLAVTVTVHLLVVFASLHVSSCVSSSVSSVSSLLETGRGIDKLFKVFIWSLPCKCSSRVSL